MGGWVCVDRLISHLGEDAAEVGDQGDEGRGEGDLDGAERLVVWCVRLFVYVCGGQSDTTPLLPLSLHACAWHGAGRARMHARTHRVGLGPLPEEAHGGGERGREVVGEEVEEYLEVVRVEGRPPEVAVEDDAQEEELHADGLLLVSQVVR